MSVCCECSVLSRRGLFDELITRPEESYQLWRVVVWSAALGGGPQLLYFRLSNLKFVAY